MAYEININAFQGPFDLLFYLIQKNEVNLYDIPIAQITDQYLVYLEQLEELDLDTISEFVLLAARLLAIKAKMILPKPIKDDINEGDEVDPRDELVSQLLEYQIFKEASFYLKQQEQYSGQIFTRGVDFEEMVELYGGKVQLKNLSVTSLAKAFESVLARLNLEEPVTKMAREEITLEDKMAEITKKLFLAPNGLRFSQLLGESHSISELVVAFMALLELSKIQHIYLEQSQLFGDIIIIRHSNLDSIEEVE